MVQWLGCHISIAGGIGLIPGQGTKILGVTQPSLPCTKKRGKVVTIQNETVLRCS